MTATADSDGDPPRSPFSDPVRTPDREANAGTARGEAAFERTLQRSRALAAVRRLATGLFRARPVERFRRLGEVLAAAAEGGGAPEDHQARDGVAAGDPWLTAGAGPEALERLLLAATTLPLPAIRAVLDQEEPAVHYRPDALADLGRRGLGLEWGAFAALLRRDAESYPADVLACDVGDALTAVEREWREPDEHLDGPGEPRPAGGGERHARPDRGDETA